MKSRTILITGVTRGLGHAMAEEFIRCGKIVIGCGRSSGLIEQMRSSFKGGHSFSTVDVSRDGEVSEWARVIRATDNVPDILINNAALINRNAPLWEIDSAEFDAVMDVNVTGVANVIRHFVPLMIGRGYGLVVNFSSGWGRSTSPGVAPYCATKWAIEGLTQALAQELPAGLSAVALNPGIINTEMLQSCFGAGAEAYPSASRWARSAVPYIISLNATHNGQALTVPA